MIQVDLTHMRRFIALPYEAALAPRLRIAHNHLQKNDGAGGDFTAWMRSNSCRSYSWGRRTQPVKSPPGPLCSASIRAASRRAPSRLDR